MHQSPAILISKVIQGTVANPRDLTGRWRANWDDKNLYIWVGVVDESHLSDSKDYWQDDSIEIYIDADASRGDSYDNFNDFHLGFSLGNNKINAGGTTPKDKLSLIKYTTRQLPTGYQLEVAIPWSTLNIIPKSEHTLGFDIQINDDDNGNDRDAKMSWNASVDQAWKNPEIFGQLILRDDAQNFTDSNKQNKPDKSKSYDKSAFSYE
ncbi:MAG: sugar-binding protein [Cocleimonas sp.]